MKLNRTGSVWDRNERNKINDNWDKLEGNVNNLQNEITDKVLTEIKDSAKLNWGTPVNNFSELPSNSKEGDTRFTRDTGKVYRFDGKSWKEIQEIDAGPVNEVDSRLSAQLNETQKNINVTNDDAFYGGVTYNRVQRPSLTLIDDDAFPQVYQYLKPIVEEEGVPITIAVIPHRVGHPSYVESSMTLPQIKECEEAGMEIVSHTMQHKRMNNLTEEEVHYECRESKKWLHEHGFNTNILVYPFGSANETVRNIARQYYRASFQIDGGQGQVNHPPLDQNQIRRVNYNSEGGINNVDYVKQYIDEAVSTNGWLTVMMHCFYSGFDPEGVREIIRYAKSKGVDIITAKEGIERFGNIIDTPEFQIAADGKVTRGGFIRIGGVSGLTPIEDFPVGVSESYLSGNNIVGLPVNTGGVLTTHKFLNSQGNPMGYRTFTTYTSGLVYTQTYDVSTGDWGVWRKSFSGSESRNRGWDYGNIPSKSCVTKKITVPTVFTDRKPVFSRPEGELADGLVFSFSVDSSTNTAFYKICNITDSDINAGRINFKEFELNLQS